MSATAVSVLDRFDDVFGSRRGSEGHRQRALVPLFTDIAAGRLHRPLDYLTERYHEGALESDQEPSLSALVDAYASEMASQAVARWRPSVAAYLKQFGISPTPQMVADAQKRLHEWVYGLRYAPDIHFNDGDQGWNDAWADARMQEGSAEVLAPIFRAAPKIRMTRAIGFATYSGIDMRCYKEHGESAEARARRYDTTRWGKVFDMLSDYGPVSIDPGQPARAKEEVIWPLAKTFTALLEGEF